MAFKTRRSPLWRIGFYGCENVPRLRVGTKDAFARRVKEIDKLLTEAGLKIIGQGVIRYSNHGAHGYTYFSGLMQSGVILHTYPERNYRSVTINIETCEPREEMQPIIDKVTEDLKWYFGAKRLRRIRSDDLPLRSKDVCKKRRRRKKKKGSKR